MELAYAFFAKAAQFSEDGLGIIGGDIQSLKGVIPYTADALTLVAKLEFRAEECGRSYVFQIEVTDPEGQNAPVGSLEVTPPHPRQKGRIGAVVLFDFAGMTFSRPGTFRFRILVDGASLGTLELTVYAEQGALEPVATT
jgi:hypothetical protein